MIPKRHRKWAGLALAGALVALAAAAWQMGRDRSSAAPQIEPVPTDASDPLRQQVLGTWYDDYQGKRTMCLDRDGRGTMTVELTGWRATLAAPRLRFDMTWTVEPGLLKLQSVGGEPAAITQAILKTMGDHSNQRILELTESRLLLLDPDGKTRYDWRRTP